MSQNNSPTGNSGGGQPNRLDSLRVIVEHEAKRILTEEQFEPDPALIAQGWERRFLADARQAKEAVELYSELGFEVHCIPLQPVELSDDCEGCRLAVAFQFQTIYTRSRAAAPSDTVEEQ